MNKYIEKWQEYLRSGKFKQGYKCLFNVRNDTYCCLGVLGKIGIEEGILSKYDSRTGYLIPKHGEESRECSLSEIDWRDEFYLPLIVNNIPQKEAFLNKIDDILKLKGKVDGIYSLINRYCQTTRSIDLLDNVAVQDVLWHLNDIYNFSFLEIAEVIEFLKVKE